MNIVIDTNIVISALIKDKFTRYFITHSKNNFLIPEFELVEIYNHKEEIMYKSNLSEIEFNILLLRLLKYIRIIPTHMLIDKEKQARKIIGHIDDDDVQFIAAALKFNCPIWSDDKHFKKQNAIEVLTTKQILKK